MCGATNTSLGLGTGAQSNRHSIGLSYQYRSYESIHPSLYSLPVTPTHEYFQRYELTGLIRLSNRFQLRLSVPIVANKQEEKDTVHFKRGIGDAQVMINFFLVNQSKSDSNCVKQIRWSIGAGVKNPTGEAPRLTSSQRMLFPGTGSFDAQFASNFYIRKNSWGLIQQSQLILRTENKTGFQFGNAVNLNLLALRKWESCSVFAGTQFAWNGSSYMNRKVSEDVLSNGTIATLAIGASFQKNNLLFQISGELPYYQNLGNGSVHQQLSFSAGINYLFNEK